VGTDRYVGRWRRSLVGLACAGLLLTGCGDSEGPGQSTVEPPREEDAATLVERALAARSANSLTEFAALVSAAGKACPDPAASRRLGQLAIIAGQWSSAVEAGRPKLQAVTEAQLAAVDWAALAAACDVP
jgi:uncharacterized protein HemY